MQVSTNTHTRNCLATHADVLVSLLLQADALVFVPSLALLLVQGSLDLIGVHEGAPGLSLPLSLGEFAL